MKTKHWAVAALLACLAVGTASSTVAEPSDGWRPLFNGKDLSGWTDAAGKAPGKGWIVADGAMVREKSAGDIWTKDRFGNFVLDLEFKTEGNSGIFIRTDDPRDNVQTGIEIQVYKPVGKPKTHTCGAVYDALAPTKDVVKADAWNRVAITAKDNRMEVVMNGEKIIDMDLDRWSTPGRNPDGTKNKYRNALKDFKREGHVGLQDHGAKVSYRNLKIRPLEAK